jgi:D-sedoheptulose 7-phosphate isomerase
MNFEDYNKIIYEGLNKVNQNSLNNFINFIKHHRDYTYYIIGNGGSASNASHFAQDLFKICQVNAISLCDNISYITATANDESYINIFSNQLEIKLANKDALIAISGSGNSKNITKAVYLAKELSTMTFGFTGFNGGELGKMVNGHINVPINDMGMVEGIHSILFHYITKQVGNRETI